MRGLKSVLFMVAFAACGNGQVASMNAAALEGEWAFLFEEAEADCEPETGGAFELAVHVDHTITDVLSDDVHVSGRWSTPSDPEEWSGMEGVFDLGRGRMELTLWGAQRFENSPRILITGDVDDRLAVTGQWWEGGGGVLYDGGCSGSVEGHPVS